MHFVRTHESTEIKFRPGYMKTDFNEAWSKTTESSRDHAGSAGVTIRTLNEGNYTKTAMAKYKKIYCEQNGKEAKDKFMEWPGSYECHVVLLGVTKWVAVRKVRKIVNHHVKEVTERRTYKSRPKTPLKGSTLYAVGKFMVSFDGREYDPLEH